MRDTYWLVLVAFALAALALWLGMASGKRRAEKLLLEAQLRGTMPSTGSIWTRDLLDNRFGRFLRCYVLPILLITVGLIQAVTQHATFKGFDYRGFDAVCIGIGLIGLGITSLAANTLPARNPYEQKIRLVACWSGALTFVVTFSIALFRNI